jgi:N-acetylmuramoyl-L-alanine amidase
VSIAYYRTEGFESAGGRELAALIAQALGALPLARPAIAGMRLAVLRETRMPAVLCTLGPVRAAVDQAPEIAAAAAAAVECWVKRLPST